MDQRTESISVKGGPAIETTICNPDDHDWIAGPLPLSTVDVAHDRHFVIIVGGPRDGWEAVAGHSIDRENAQAIYLNGKEPLQSVHDDPDAATARILQVTEDK